MAAELVADSVLEHAGATPVDDAYIAQARNRSVVDQSAHCLTGFLSAPTADVDFLRNVGRGGGADANRRRFRVGSNVRLQAGERNPHALSGAAGDLRHLALDFDDRAADAECRRLDGIADGERRDDRERLLERVELAFGACRVLARGAEEAVTGLLSLPAGRRRALDRLLLAAGRADLLPERCELGAGGGEIGVRLRDRSFALDGGRGSHALDLCGERGLALSRQLGRRLRISVLVECGRPFCDCCSLGGFRLGEQGGDPMSLRCDRPLRVRNDLGVETESLGRPERMRGTSAADDDPVERLVRFRVDRGRGVCGGSDGAGPAGVARRYDQLERDPR